MHTCSTHFATSPRDYPSFRLVPHHLVQAPSHQCRTSAKAPQKLPRPCQTRPLILCSPTASQFQLVHTTRSHHSPCSQNRLCPCLHLSSGLLPFVLDGFGASCCSCSLHRLHRRHLLLLVLPPPPPPAPLVPPPAPPPPLLVLPPPPPPPLASAPSPPQSHSNPHSAGCASSSRCSASRARVSAPPPLTNSPAPPPGRTCWSCLALPRPTPLPESFGAGHSRTAPARAPPPPPDGRANRTMPEIAEKEGFPHAKYTARDCIKDHKRLSLYI